ncbi:MAG TPA: PilZ domain-containing protein [Candidatus Acidoferrales bacterium]|nr:PilZ domain-containing protein [Candidatus Acidoferrales bacterium]
MRVQNGRMEPRTRLRIPVQLASLDSPGRAETTLTENISPLGIRAVTKRPWQLGESVMVISPVGDLRTPARVVYCQRVNENEFGLGLQFLGPQLKWGGSAGRTPLPGGIGTRR